MKHFINIKDIPSKDLKKIILDAKRRKNSRKNFNKLDPDKDLALKGKLLIQMFEKSSLRTRLSFYIAIKQLSGDELTLRSDELHLGKGTESLSDTAKIISTFGNAFMLRTDSDKKINEFKKHMTVPIINGLSPSSHPTQILSDVFTIEEIKKNIQCLMNENEKNKRQKVKEVVKIKKVKGDPIVKTKYVTILYNDCYIISDNYFSDILDHMDKNNFILSSCKTLNRKKIGINKIKIYKKIYNFFCKQKLKYLTKARRQGWLMTLNLQEYKKLNYYIPDYIKIWYGDDWIWSQIIKQAFLLY